MSRFGGMRWPLEAGCWVVAVAYATGIIVSGVGNFARHAAWVYTATSVVAGAVALSFVLTALVLAVTARGRQRHAGRVRTAITLWRENASSTERAAVVGAGVLGVCLTVAGIVGSAQHPDLVTRTSFVVTQHLFDEFMYPRYVLGVLGPAMTVSSLLFLIYRAFLLVMRHPYRGMPDGTSTARKPSAA